MKLKCLAIACVLTACSATYADNNLFANSRFGVQGAITTDGDIGIGVVNYSEMYEMGFTLSGSVSNNNTNSVSPSIFAGLRKPLLEHTLFAYGLNGGATFGETANVDTRSYEVGPYISLEQELTHSLLLSGWINPYAYGYQKTGGTSTTTNNFFNTGGISLTYFF